MTTATKGTSPVTCSTDYDDLNARIATLTAERDAARAELARCREASSAYATREHRMRGIMAHDNSWTPTHKLYMMGECLAYERKMQDEGLPLIPADGAEPPMRTTYRGEIMKLTGLSDSAVSDASAEMARQGAIHRKVRKTRDAAGGLQTFIDCSPTRLALTAPQRVKAPPDVPIKKWGGKREKCPGCGSENIVERRNWYCADCGELVKAFEDRPVNPPDLHPVELVTEDVPPAPDAASRSEQHNPTTIKPIADEPAPEPEPETQPEPEPEPQPEPVKLPGRWCPNNPEPPFSHTPRDLESGHTRCGKCGAFLGMWDRNSARRLVRSGGKSA